MKIAFLSWFSGDRYRGVETFVHQLANSLIDLENDVIVYQHGKKLPDTKYRVGYLNNQHLLPNLERDIDILVPLNGDIQVWLSKMWCVLYNKKLVVTGQSGPGLGDRIKVLAFPDVFISLSDFQTNWCHRCNPFVKVEKIYNGVDLDKFKQGKTKLNFNLNKPIILWVGALESMKRPDLVIKTVSRLDASLLIVGKGNLEQELFNLGQQLMPGRMIIKAFKHAEMPEVYKAADLFVFSTVPWESFGIVMLEAMAANLPVVVSDDPIRKGIIGNAGFTVDVTNTCAFAQKIKDALNKDWGDLPRRRARQFSWNKVAKRYDQVFRNTTGL
jgi:glycosyltransferase involved in cell wall biosynthesis